ncbi:MAG: YdbH domain-containing protein [Bacteriovoracaceae bacterium]|nr:YdbH domain-containing protein [Bacteriovoracaceae bacterium]
MTEGQNNKKKVILGVLVVLPLLIVLLISLAIRIYGTTVLEQELKAWVKEQGVKNLNFTIKHISLNETDITNVTLGDSKFVSIDEVKIKHPVAKLRTYKVDSLAISGLKLHFLIKDNKVDLTELEKTIKLVSSNSNSKTEPGLVIVPLVQKVLVKKSFIQLDADDYNIKIPIDTKIDIKSGELTLSYDEKSILSGKMIYGEQVVLEDISVDTKFILHLYNNRAKFQLDKFAVRSNKDICFDEGPGGAKSCLENMNLSLGDPPAQIDVDFQDHQHPFFKFGISFISDHLNLRHKNPISLEQLTCKVSGSGNSKQSNIDLLYELKNLKSNILKKRDLLLSSSGSVKVLNLQQITSSHHVVDELKLVNLKATADFDVASKMAEVDFLTNVKLEDDFTKIVQYLPSLKEQVLKPTGAINVIGKVKMHGSKMTPVIRAKLDKISFESFGAAINGINSKILLDSITPLNTSKVQQITVDEVKSHISIKKIDLQYKLLTKDDLYIKSFKAQLLGGLVEFNKVKVDLKFKKYPKVFLKAAGWDLRQVLTLFLKPEAISATGKISGILPLSLIGTNFNVKNGKLHSDAHGIVRYRPNEASPLKLAKSKETADLLMYLDNFHYKTITMLVSADKIVMIFLGKNPDLKNVKRPVRLQMTLNGNLIRMFKKELEAYQLPQKYLKHKML